jgi:hypothetical protein
MDIFVKKLSDNKSYEFYFTFTKQEINDCTLKQSIGKDNAFDFIRNLIEEAIIKPNKEDKLVELIEDEPAFEPVYEYGCNAGNGWLLHEIISSDFKGEIKPYEEVFVVFINQEQPKIVRSHADELISTICYKLAEWNTPVKKFMINAL